MAGDTGRSARQATPVEPGREPIGVVVPRRQIRSGPLLRPIDEVADKPGLETRLPLLILLALGVLVAVQVLLAL